MSGYEMISSTEPSNILGLSLTISQWRVLGTDNCLSVVVITYDTTGRKDQKTNLGRTQYCCAKDDTFSFADIGMNKENHTEFP